MVDQEAVKKARDAADRVRPYSPETAALIEAAINDYAAGRRDGLKVDVSIAYKLEKFDGEYSPGMQPVEVITGVG